MVLRSTSSIILFCFAVEFVVGTTNQTLNQSTTTNVPKSSTITTRIASSTTEVVSTTRKIYSSTARPSRGPTNSPTSSPSPTQISTIIPHSTLRTVAPLSTSPTSQTTTGTSRTTNPPQLKTTTVQTTTPTRLSTARPTSSQPPLPPDGDEWTVVIDYTVEGTTARMKDNDTVRLIFKDLLAQNLSVSMKSVFVNVISYHKLMNLPPARRVLLATQFQFILKAHIHVKVNSETEGQQKIVIFESQKNILKVAIQQKLQVIKIKSCTAVAFLRVGPSTKAPTEQTVSVWTVIAWFVGGIGVVALVCLGGLICHRRMHADVMFSGDDPNDPNAGINLDRLLDPQIPLIDDVLMSTPHDEHPWLTPGTSVNPGGSAAAFYRPNMDDDDEEDQRFTRLV